MKFYFKLAASNLKADRRLFVPFVTTTSFLMAVNLIMLNAYASSDVLFKKLGAAAGKSLFMFGTDVIVIISVILAIYANNFLRKQRIRQLGLYNIIGFGKGELGKMMAVEKLLLLLTTLLFGGILGTVLSRISYLALAKMLKVDHNLDFGLSQQAFSIAGIITIGLFVVLLLVDELWLIRKRPIEIVRAQRAGEREPKTKWVTLIVSLIALIAGYYIAVTTTNPLQAMSMFFVAVILVICGTYGLFTAGSVFVLKWLRNRKNYYYKPKHFINVANLLYRMQQNGAGLASIAILVTMTSMKSSIRIRQLICHMFSRQTTPLHPARWHGWPARIMSSSSHNTLLLDRPVRWLYLMAIVLNRRPMSMVRSVWAMRARCN